VTLTLKSYFQTYFIPLVHGYIKEAKALFISITKKAAKPEGELVNGREINIVKISLNSSPFVTDSEIQSYNFIFNYRGVIRLYTQC